MIPGNVHRVLPADWDRTERNNDTAGPAFGRSHVTRAGETAIECRWFAGYLVPCTPIANVPLRFDGDCDNEFRDRAERVGRIAKVLLSACLNNECMRGYIEDPSTLHSVESVLRSPTVRVEYEQAIAIGGIGECLAATKTKKWGDGPWVLPLNVDDWFYPDRITYLFRSNSLYNRRFHQRRRMKKLLGKHRSLVGNAKSSTKTLFLKDLTREQVQAIQRIFHVGPGEFWRAAKGRAWLDLPPEFIQGDLFDPLSDFIQ